MKYKTKNSIIYMEIGKLEHKNVFYDVEQKNTPDNLYYAYFKTSKILDYQKIAVTCGPYRAGNYRTLKY